MYTSFVMCIRMPLLCITHIIVYYTRTFCSNEICQNGWCRSWVDSPLDCAVFVRLGFVAYTAVVRLWQLWDIRDGMCKQTFSGHESDINAITV